MNREINDRGAVSKPIYEIDKTQSVGLWILDSGKGVDDDGNIYRIGTLEVEGTVYKIWEKIEEDGTRNTKS